MLDIVIETIRSFVLLGIVVYLVHSEKNRFEQNRTGWNLILIGFSLLTLGSFIDITDNFESLSRYVVIGDTETEAILEKLVVSLGGFVFLAIGLILWLPNVERLSLEIAERKRAVEVLGETEDGLRASETRFRDFAESSADWLWEMDKDLRFTYLSSNVERVVGVPPEWHYGKSREDILGGEYDREIWNDHLEDLASRKPFRNFIYQRAGDGIETKWLSTSGKPVFDRDGGFLGYRGSGSDVTALKNREFALRKSEANLREILEKSPIGVAIVFHERTDGHVEAKRLFANDALAEIFGGTSPDEMIEAEISGTWVDLDQFYKVNEAMKNGVDLIDFEARRLRADGTEIWLSMNTRPVSFDNQDCTMVWHFDITNRKQAEESSHQLVVAIDAMSDSVSVFDDDDRLIFCNDQFRVLNGAAPEISVLGTTFEDQMKAVLARGLVPDAIGREEDWLRQRLHRHRNPEGPFEILRLDGVWLRVSEQKLPIGGMITLASDVSASKGVEEQLRQAQKMEVVGQLTGGIAHDFNNILAAIVGNLSLLQDSKTIRDATDNESIAIALRASLRGAELTHRLLAFSRQQELDAKAVKINELLPHFHQLAERTIGKDIAIKIIPAAGLWQTMVDAGQLENALLNLAINARDAMPDGGLLTFETANRILEQDDAERFDDLAPGEYVTISVSDTGTGMSADVLARVFEPFFTTKEVGRGSGLGLSMVFGLVRQSGGQVSIYSEEGEGTTVRIYLPRAEQATDTESTNGEDEQARPTGHETILVVEDDGDVRRYLVTVLNRLGYTVLQAEDGPAALEIMAAADGIDLLLSDMILPRGMSGRDVAAAFHKRYPAAKVLYSSGYTREVLNRRGSLGEDAALLSKPYQTTALAQRVQAILDGGN